MADHLRNPITHFCFEASRTWLFEFFVGCWSHFWAAEAATFRRTMPERACDGFPSMSWNVMKEIWRSLFLTLMGQKKDFDASCSQILMQTLQCQPQISSLARIVFFRIFRVPNSIESCHYLVVVTCSTPPRFRQGFVSCRVDRNRSLRRVWCASGIRRHCSRCRQCEK